MKKQWISLCLALSLLLGCTLPVWAECEKGEACPSGSYEDVENDAWYHGDLDDMIEKGILKGVSEKSMDPDGTMSRGMFVTMLHRLEGAPEVGTASQFKDVAADSWYTEAVVWAENNGVVNGYSNEVFAPEDRVTREQMAVMLYRYAELKYFDTEPSAELEAFADAKEVSDWALDAVKWACASGLLLGDEQGNLLPASDALRCQSAAVLNRFNNHVYVEYSAVVESSEALQEALTAGGEIVIVENVKLEEPAAITEDTVITLAADLDASSVASRPFEVAEGANLTVNAKDNTVTVGAYGLVNIPAEVKEASVTLNGGTYEGNTDNGSFIKVRPGNEKVTITLNDVTYTDASDDGWILNSYGVDGEVNVVINGGSFTAQNGLQIKGDTVITDAKIITRDLGFEVDAGETVIENCKIVVDTDTVNPAAPAAAVAAAGNAKITVKNSTIAGNMYAAYEVYSSGGTVIAENNDITGATYMNRNNTAYWYDLDHNTYPEAFAYIMIDGEVVVDQPQA